MLFAGDVVAVSAGGTTLAALTPTVFVVVVVSVVRRGGVGTEGALGLGLGTAGSSDGLGRTGAVGDGVSGGLAVDTVLGLAGPRVSSTLATEGAGGSDDESATLVVDTLVVLVDDTSVVSLVDNATTDDSGATVLDALAVARALVVDSDVLLSVLFCDNRLLHQEDGGEGIK